VCPSSRRAEIIASGLQPGGIAARRVISPDVVKNIKQSIPRLQAQDFLHPNAVEYLVAWSEGTTVRQCRPALYRCLAHNWKSSERAVRVADRIYDGMEPMRGVRAEDVAVIAGPMPMEDGAEDADAGDDDEDRAVHLFVGAGDAEVVE